MQSGDDRDRDAAALAALAVGRSKLLQALNNVGYLPSYDRGGRRASNRGEASHRCPSTG